MDITSFLLGKQAGGGGGSANLQSNKNVSITTNGTQVVNPDSGYDGLKKATITTNITPTLQEKDVSILSNGSTTVNPDQGYDGLDKVNITTNVTPNLESKSLTIDENTTTTITPSTGYDGLSSVSVTTAVVDAPPVFSSTEVVVGTWIDNKPLYMRTFTGDISTTNTGGFNTTIELDISDTLDLIFLGDNSFFTTTDGDSYSPNYIYTNSSGSVTSLVKTRLTKVNKTIITVCYGSLFPTNSSVSYTFNIFYVKTNDSPASNVSSILGNHFSTDEHSVGTDDNGNEIYEKTITSTTSGYSNNNPVNKTITHNISNIDKVWIANGSFMYSTGSTQGETLPLQYFNHYQNLQRQTARANVNKTQINIFDGDWSMNPGTIYHYITLRYIKNTA